MSRVRVEEEAVSERVRAAKVYEEPNPSLYKGAADGSTVSCGRHFACVLTGEPEPRLSRIILGLHYIREQEAPCSPMQTPTKPPARKESERPSPTPSPSKSGPNPHMIGRHVLYNQATLSAHMWQVRPKLESVIMMEVRYCAYKAVDKAGRVNIDDIT